MVQMFLGAGVESNTRREMHCGEGEGGERERERQRYIYIYIYRYIEIDR